MTTSKNTGFRPAASLRYLAPILSYGKLVLRPTMHAERRRSVNDSKHVCRHGQ